MGIPMHATSNDPGHTFLTDVTASVETLRGAIKRSLHGSPTATELSRRLSFSTKLGWKIHWLLNHHDPITAALYVPGRAGLKSVADGLRKAGADEGKVAEVEQAADGFLECVDRLADDRLSFDTLVASISSKEKYAEECRKLAHQGARFVWGIEAELNHAVYIVHPSTKVGRAQGDFLDIARVRGIVGCQRLRADVPLRLGHWVREHDQLMGDSGHAVAGPVAIPSLTDGAADGPPVMREYSSNPLPEFVGKSRKGGGLEYRLGPTPIGKMGRFDLVIADLVWQGVGRSDWEQSKTQTMHFMLRMPAKLAVLDVLIHRDLYDGRVPSVRLVNDLYDSSRVEEYDGSDTLPNVPRAETLRAMEREMAVAEHPGLAKAVIQVIEELGWDAEKLDAYRLRMPYAPIPITMALQFEV